MNKKQMSLLLYALSGILVTAGGCEMPTVGAADCVRVKYVQDVWMNKQGTKVAYLVKAPNLIENRNDYQLYAKELAEHGSGSGSLIISGSDISEVNWLGDGVHLAFRMPVKGIASIVLVDSSSGASESIPEKKAIGTFTINDDGDVVVYSVPDSPAGSRLSTAHTDDEMASGYRVELAEKTDTNVWPTSSLYLRRRVAGGGWGSPSALVIHDPFTHSAITHVVVPDYLKLSPDGLRLALNIWTDNSEIPVDWHANPFVEDAMEAQPKQRIMVLEDLRSGHTALAFKTVYPDSAPLWSPDSRSFLMNAHSPPGSVWEQQDIRDHRVSNSDANLFWVDADSGETEEVYPHVPYHHQGPFAWTRNGDVLVHTAGDSVARFHHEKHSWQQVLRFAIPRTEKDRFWFTANEDLVVGIREQIAVPGNIFIFKPGEEKIRIVTDLNPQLENVRFAKVMPFHWMTSAKMNVDGYLFVPPDYQPGRRYPLVIQTKGTSGGFTCDSGINHDPAFSPQPLAAAGVLYLIRTVREGYNYQDERAFVPNGYPGRIGEDIQTMDIWDSAISSLSEQGLVDPSRVGILGFSFTGWEVLFMLTHSSIHFAAATVSDNAQYSLSEYWLIPSGRTDAENRFGGPPYGKTLADWQRYSISFNLDKVHTPLLMEQMGYGVHDSVQGEKPINLMLNYEILGGLDRLKKPVEMYYYPDEQHQPDHPRARLATLQRNVDWYRFWLQGYEDHATAKADQYMRWRQLKQRKDADQTGFLQVSP